MYFIACLSTGKGTWAEVSKIMTDQDWSKIILISNDFGKQNFTHAKPFDLIEINPNQDVELLVADLKTKLKPKINDLEVGVNITSGSGKEHTALLASLLQLGIGIRFIALSSTGIKEI